MTTCTQKTDCGHECGRPHHATMRWPGREPAPVCYAHAVRGAGIAEHLGFELDLRWTPEGEEYRRALLTIEALQEPER